MKTSFRLLIRQFSPQEVLNFLTLNKILFYTTVVLLSLLQLQEQMPLSFNPLSPKSDQHQISPCNINALSNKMVMRIRDMITQDEFV